MYKAQIQELLTAYPALQYYEEQGIIMGVLHINHTCYNEHIVADYEVRIELSDDFVVKLPDVYEISGSVPDDYKHLYKNKRLCLSTDIEQNIHFIDGGTLLSWFNEYVITFFFTLEYYMKYDVFPNGDRAHNGHGILQSYMELFEVDTIKKAYDIMKYVIECDYRGHIDCPCGSEKKIRNCHKNTLLKWCKPEYKEPFSRDFNRINWEVKELAQYFQRAK